MELARHLEPLSDYFLTDTLLTAGSRVGNQPETGYVGITGSTCDWNIAAALVSQSSIPVIAAGGLSPENVAEAIRVIRPAGVDSCSLTNAEDESGRPIRFRKDPGKVARFVAEARRVAKDILN
jgi:phosphoribosylanthranilate isomerase